MVKQTNEIYDIGGHIPQMPAGRKCLQCGKRLSIYNKNDRCYACMKKFIDSIPDIPIKKVWRPLVTADDPFERQTGTKAILDALKAIEAKEETEAAATVEKAKKPWK
jgi:hypothetical protein